MVAAGGRVGGGERGFDSEKSGAECDRGRRREGGEKVKERGRIGR
jgi:hypothetical protein